ncbi:carbon-nitrogen hydrolase family protein [Sphingomonadaceae bacterium G21617-S1]|uniref:carbon-nitrogen hydrolase family protein n=1 Tax=Rhizorhabdus sp. TaxID=1968843 RepID=UPI0019CC15A6|nr:carbon-nitrogen hydrolase family protein [Rhizorhabdus sp.]MBD3761016.1 carbon-nitrogen hydrolase family protein [Rhizorhabdus sp.]MCZ4341196.1 carbon-nitrogen hydrolase family protein [Sphingomonadaceae bacterium G21617-S1]
MGDEYPTVRMAAVQASPVWLDRDATTAKAVKIIEEAGDAGAKIIGFPECFIPCYPDWYHWYMPLSPASVKFQRELFKNAVEIPSKTVSILCAAARRANICVVMGINERSPGTLGTLYNSQLFIDQNGEVLGVHRKLVPTLTERLVYLGGDGSCIQTYPTSFGAIGGLICGENLNSLARFALLAQHERFHIGSWPAFLQARQREAIGIRLRYHALEGRTFVISSCAIFDDDCFDAMGLSAEQRNEVTVRGGGSGIIGPDGNYIVGPVDDSPQILYADADIDRIIDGKLAHDLIGHSNRFDVFTLQVKTSRRVPYENLDTGEPHQESDDAV